METIDQEETLKQFGYRLPMHSTDKCYALCSVCKQPKETTLRAIRRTLKKRKTYRCGLCAARSEEGRAARSKQAKNIWSDPVLSKQITDKNVQKARSDEGRRQRSKQAKKAWLDPVFADQQKERICKMFKSEAHRSLVSERNKKDYLENPEEYLSKKTSALQTDEARLAHREAVSKPEYKQMHRELALERFKSPEYKAKIALGLEGFSRGGRMSNPETVVLEFLKNNGYDFIYNKQLGPYNFDFFIPKENLFIEVQGEYWHTLPNNERRDRSKYSYLRSAVPSAKIIYIWDFDILSGEYKNKLQQAFGMSSFPNLDFDLTDVRVEAASKEAARKFFSSWHYAQFGKQGKFLAGAFLGEQMIAAAKFGPVSRLEIATSLGADAKSVYELDRFCIHPMRQKKNAGSYFLSRFTRMFFDRFPECLKIVAFSDSTFGHDGTIYKASNWELVGTTRPDYVYVREDGWILHKKTLYNQARSVHMAESEYAEKHGWKKVFGKEKTKFVISRS